MSSFLGRSDEISELTDLLERSRLLTLTGAPGIGKTQLGLQVATRHPREAAMVELASVVDPALVPHAVAAALSVQEVPGQTITDTVVGHLRGRSLLVVLDNCEHLVGACAQLVDALGGCPDLRVLTTSQEPLRIGGERVWQVTGLSVPNPAESAPEALMGYEAVQLFVERAGAVKPDFAFDASVGPAVAEIARRLDGIPLAIELAAARVVVLNPAEIARRLDERFSLLTTGSRSVLPRHQTLQGALDWSFELLSAPERALLRRLSVFVGRFDLEAAAAVCPGDEVEAGQVFDLLARLVMRSLLVSDAGDSSTTRYRLLETIRAYASDRLEEAGEAGAFRDGHARFYLELAERAEPELTGPDQERWLDRLETEQANLRCALEWSLIDHQEWGLRLAGALVLFWRVRGYFREGRDMLAAALSAGQGASAQLLAKGLWGAGFLGLMAGDPQGALATLEESLWRFRQLGDRRGAARALLLLGNCKQYTDERSALALLEQSADLARQARDSWCLSHALGIAGLDYGSRGELSAARPLFEECLAVARAAKDKQGLRLGLFGLGSVCLRQGDYGEAQSLLEEAVTLTDELREDYGRATALQYLGHLALGRGEYGRARELLEEALTLIEGVGPPAAVHDLLCVLGTVAHAEGDRRRARRLFEQAAADAGDGAPVAVLQGLGELAFEDGDTSLAGRLWEEARELAQAGGHKSALPQALYSLGRLAREEENAERAAALHHDALELRTGVGEAPGVAASLEAVAGLSAAAGRHRHAARLFGAAHTLRLSGAHTLRLSGGYARAPWESSRYDADVALVRDGLSADEFEDAWEQGAGLSIAEAVAQAGKGRGRRGRPAGGWASLTESEQQVAALVAEGLTNPEIAQRLFISLGTVKAHLSHIFAKLGVAGRRELAREVRRRRSPGGASPSDPRSPQRYHQSA